MTGKGVVVTSVDPDSGLGGSTGLEWGNVLYGINHCKVHSENDWSMCVEEMRRTHYGYCVPKRDVISGRANRVWNVYGELHCCHNANVTASHLCFYYKNETIAKTEFEYSCLSARYTTDHHYICNSSLPCRVGRTTCVYPALFNSTKLFRFLVAGSNRKPVLFVGHWSDVDRFLKVSGYVPRSDWLPISVPDLVDLFCKYLITLSLGLDSWTLSLAIIWMVSLLFVLCWTRFPFRTAREGGEELFAFLSCFWEPYY